MKRSVLLLLLSATTSLSLAQQPPSPPAFAAPSLSPAGVRSMAANCSACHGTNGRPAPASAVPGLAGYERDKFVVSMKEFKEGKRQATIMHQISKGYADAEIEALADYFSRQPR